MPAIGDETEQKRDDDDGDGHASDDGIVQNSITKFLGLGLTDSPTTSFLQ